MKFLERCIAFFSLSDFVVLKWKKLGYTQNAGNETVWWKHQADEIKTDREDIGILGSATVAILESHDKAVKYFELNSRDIEVGGELLHLKENLK